MMTVDTQSGAARSSLSNTSSVSLEISSGSPAGSGPSPTADSGPAGLQGGGDSCRTAVQRCAQTLLMVVDKTVRGATAGALAGIAMKCGDLALQQTIPYYFFFAYPIDVRAVIASGALVGGVAGCLYGAHTSREDARNEPN